MAQAEQEAAAIIAQAHTEAAALRRQAETRLNDAARRLVELITTSAGAYVGADCVRPDDWPWQSLSSHH
jgi:hypothetical protein